MYGFYPSDNAASIASPSQGNRPYRPVYKPTYSYAATPSSVYPTTRPQWDHETNHISVNSPPVSYYPSTTNQRPDNHFGIVDEAGYGPEADAIYSSNNQYGTNNGYSPQHDDDDYYRPVPGTVFHTFCSSVFLYCTSILHI